MGLGEAAGARGQPTLLAKHRKAKGQQRPPRRPTSEGKGGGNTNHRDSRADGGNPCLTSPHRIRREGGRTSSSEEGWTERKLSTSLPMHGAASTEWGSDPECGSQFRSQERDVPKPPSPPSKQTLGDCLLWGISKPPKLFLRR